MTYAELLELKPWEGKEIVWVIGRNPLQVEYITRRLHMEYILVYGEVWPEHTIHPRGMKHLGEALRCYTPTAVATMSPHLLDECDLDKDEVLVVVSPDDVRLIDRERLGPQVRDVPPPARYDTDGRLASLGTLWIQRGEVWIAGVDKGDGDD